MSKNRNQYSVHRTGLQQLQTEGLMSTAQLLEQMGHETSRGIGNIQTKISEKLSKQVIDAFWSLLRGFEAVYLGNNKDHQTTFLKLIEEDISEIYEGVLTTIMRLIFLIYIEEEDLIQNDKSLVNNQQSYSVFGLFNQLEEDAIRYHDSMSQRQGAWAYLITLTHMIFKCGAYQGFQMPVGHGEIFDPERFPFLEGYSQTQSIRSHGPYMSTISDDCIHEVLTKLLVLDGERLSYHALGVEQIGSVYESMMGYNVERAQSNSVILQPKDIVIPLDKCLEVSGENRVKWLNNHAELTFKTSKAEKALIKLLESATSEEELFEVLRHKRSGRGSELLIKGSLYLQPGKERRKTGSHYTPRSLSQSVIAKALNPHLSHIKKQPKEKWASAILGLKVCDPAMGSGAFLVETCRQLADELVKAWRATGQELEETGQEPSILVARRRIAQSCLYGVDKNPYAVSLAKLSLWLFTLSKNESFSFLDHSLRCGDSLVGIDNEDLAQIKWVSEQSIAQVPLGSSHDSCSKETKTRLNIDKEISEVYREAQQTIAELKVIADALLAVFFCYGNTRSREKARTQLEHRVYTWMKIKDKNKRSEVFRMIEVEADQLKTLNHPINSFHWGLEFPEVYMKGFDCIVGNPPFVGGRMITSNMGRIYQKWLATIFEGSQNSADICSYFFRQSFKLLKSKGTIGFVATKSISEGTTREAGLTWICDHGGVIYNAVRRRRWPCRDTNIKVSIVNIFKGQYEGQCLLDGGPVSEIRDSLTTFSFSSLPPQLEINENIAFQGSITLGMGFTFDDQSDKGVPLEKMRTILKVNPKSAERIFPYLGGRELNSDPTHRHHRYVINFETMTKAEANHWPELMQILQETVYPLRSNHKDTNVRKYPWWQHWNRRDRLYANIASSPRVLLTNAQAAAHLCFSFYEGRAIFANSINVINLSDWASFAILQSRIHEVWAKAFSTSLGDQIRYNPTTCFRTFPRPTNNLDELNRIGKTYHNFRAKLMKNTKEREALMNGLDPEGLTETYNKFHRKSCHLSGITKLRKLHAEMDQAVANAMGWHDLSLDYDWIDQFTDRTVQSRLTELEYAKSLGKDDEVEEFEMKPRLTFRSELKIEILNRLFRLNQTHHRSE
jgi:type I restriction-modification system DNA methylase subunit